jgi:hypothetical protein
MIRVQSNPLVQLYTVNGTLTFKTNVRMGAMVKNSDKQDRVSEAARQL